MVSLLAATLAPTLTSRAKWSIKEVNTSSRGITIKGLVSIGSRCNLNNNARIVRHPVRWFRLSNRINTL
jgi:hypothetical protein